MNDETSTLIGFVVGLAPGMIVYELTQNPLAASLVVIAGVLFGVLFANEINTLLTQISEGSGE